MNPPKERNNSITEYSLAEKNVIGAVQEDEELYDLITAVMICLGKSEETEENSLLRLLDVLLSSDTTASKKKEVLEQGLEQGKVMFVVNMLRENEPIDKICRMAECDESFVEMVKSKM